MVNSNKNCKILLWNVHFNVLEVLGDYNIHIAWFNSEKNKLSAIISGAGFYIEHSFRQFEGGGGTAIR